MIKINWNCFSPGNELVDSIIQKDKSEKNELFVFHLLRFGASYNNPKNIINILNETLNRKFKEEDIIFDFADCFLEFDNKEPIIKEFKEKFQLPFDNMFLFNIALIALIQEKRFILKEKKRNISKGNEIDEFNFLLMLLSVAKSVRDNRNKEDYEFITNIIKERLKLISENN